jgi:uncharacterized protein
MTSEHHVLPRDQFLALARGGGGIDAIGNLVEAQHSRHMIMLVGVLNAARAGAGPEGRLAVAGYEALAQAQGSDPAAAGEVIRYPSVGAWALRTLRRDDSIPGAQPGGLAAVAAAAAIRAGIATEIEVPVRDGKVVLPSLGAADAQGATAVVRTNPAEVRSGAVRVWIVPGSPGWQELRHIRVGSLDVLVDDLDPFRMPAADGEPLSRLTRTQAAELERAIGDAWEVLDPASAAEIAALIRVIVPCQGPAHGYVSTSSRETFGTIAMSQPPDPYSCAETLVHEAQHLKLGAVADLVRLTLPHDGRRYYAPWRDDPRPASALLQGTYAFLGVGGFWRRQRQAAPDDAVRRRADAEFARWRDGCAIAADTLLTSGQLTAAGQDFVGEMARLLHAWRQEEVSAAALSVAQRKADIHAEQWRAENGAVPP